MRHKPLFLIIILAILLLPIEASAGWKLVFEDEFAGPVLDKDKWFTRYIYNNGTLDRLNDEKQLYRESGNHIFNDGHLSLTAYYTGVGKYPYRSGMIRSKKTFYYGYFESRVRFPSGKGVWTGFWLNSDYSSTGKLAWPPEIDVCEFVNNGKDDTVYMIHSNTAKPSELVYAHPRLNKRWMSYMGEEDLTKDWHVFGLLWEPEFVTVYMEGIKLYKKNYRWHYTTGELAGPAHILFNLAIGGQWAGRYGIDNGAFPQSLDIDYIRVYQFDEKAPGGESPPFKEKNP